jgi:uncharacterized tellurite resistance protein B-like protein
MLQRLKALFATPPASAADLEERTQLAAAALLFELGKADYRRDTQEQKAIVAAVRSCFTLDEDMLTALLIEAEATSDNATSLHEFTSLLNQHWSDTQKFNLIRHLWQVAGADGNIHKYEDHLIRKIAELLYVPHQQFIRAKLEVLENT